MQARCGASSARNSKIFAMARQSVVVWLAPCTDPRFAAWFDPISNERGMGLRAARNEFFGAKSPQGQAEQPLCTVQIGRPAEQLEILRFVNFIAFADLGPDFSI